MKNKLKILYEDKYLLVVSKPSKLLTIANDKEKEKTLYHQVYLYLKKKNNKVYIVHRLDYDTSGLIIFAKDFKTRRQPTLSKKSTTKIEKIVTDILGNKYLVKKEKFRKTLDN